MDDTELFVKIAEHTEQIKVINHRIQDLEDTTKRIESLTLSVEKLAMSVQAMAKEQVAYGQKQNEIAKRLLEVEQSSSRDKAKKYDSYIEKIVMIVLGALISYVLYSLFGI